MNLSLRGMEIVLLGLLAAGWSAAWAQHADGSFERTMEIGGPVELDVRTGAGEIIVRAGGAGQVRVVGQLRLMPGSRLTNRETEELIRRFESEPPVEVSENRVLVGDIRELTRDVREDAWRVTIRYEIEVPRESQVRSRSGSGSHSIAGIAGAVEASAGSGTITLTGIEGSVRARTGSGSIRARDIAGSFDAAAGSGSITLEQAPSGDVTVSTGSGSSELRGIRGELRARAGSGRISVQGEPNGRWDLTSGSGAIRVQIPEGASFELEAQTNSGAIDIAHPLTVQGELNRGRLAGQVREGGPLVRVRTGSGRVRIE